MDFFLGDRGAPPTLSMSMPLWSSSSSLRDLVRFPGEQVRAPMPRLRMLDSVKDTEGGLLNWADAGPFTFDGTGPLSSEPGMTRWG